MMNLSMDEDYLTCMGPRDGFLNLKTFFTMCFISLKVKVKVKVKGLLIT